MCLWITSFVLSGVRRTSSPSSLDGSTFLQRLWTGTTTNPGFIWCSFKNSWWRITVKNDWCCDITPTAAQTPARWHTALDCAHILKTPFAVFVLSWCFSCCPRGAAVRERSLSVKLAPLVADKVVRHHVTTSPHQHIAIFWTLAPIQILRKSKSFD